MKIMRFFQIFLLFAISFFFQISLKGQDPVPYPEVPTSSDTEVKVKIKKGRNSSDGSSSSDGGTQKDVIGINTGSSPVFGAGSIDVKFEGSNVIRVPSSMQAQSDSGAGIDCNQFPNHCNVLIYEYMKKELPHTRLKSLGNRSLENVDSKSTLNDFQKKVKGSGLWVRLGSGRWIRIDENIMLAKAVINQLWRKGH